MQQKSKFLTKIYLNWNLSKSTDFRKNLPQYKCNLVFLNNIYLYQIYIVIKQREIKKNLKSIITFYINLNIISEMKGGWCYMHAGWKICELYTYYHKSHLNAIKLYDAKCISNRNISWKFVSKQFFQQTNHNEV